MFATRKRINLMTYAVWERGVRFLATNNNVRQFEGNAGRHSSGCSCGEFKIFPISAVGTARNRKSATQHSHLSPRLHSPMKASAAAGDPSPPPPRGWLSGLVSGAGRLLAAVLDPESSASDTTSSSPDSSQSPPCRDRATASTLSLSLPPIRNSKHGVNALRLCVIS